MSRISQPDELASYFDRIGHPPERSKVLAAAFIASEANVLREIKKVYGGAEIEAVGPLCAADLDPWGCWIKVDTDARREAILGDAALMLRLENAAKAGGWPATLIIESQETVDRDYQGSWFFRLR